MLISVIGQIGSGLTLFSVLLFINPKQLISLLNKLNINLE